MITSCREVVTHISEECNIYFIKRSGRTSSCQFAPIVVVPADERLAASGVTTIARSVRASLSPAISGIFLASPILFGAPFLVAGGLKMVYDLLLYRSFKTLKPPEEKQVFARQTPVL